jgi:hypothetical protein
VVAAEDSMVAAAEDSMVAAAVTAAGDIARFRRPVSHMPAASTNRSGE